MLAIDRAGSMVKKFQPKGEPAMSFNNASPHEIVAQSPTVSKKFTQERYEHLVSLLPTPERFTAAVNSLEANYPGTLKGDSDKANEFEADRKTVCSFLYLLQGVAKVVSMKDPAVLESLGLGPVPEKGTHASVVLATPHGFKVIFDQKGQPFASVAKVQGAKGYQVWACDGEPSNEANWRMVAFSIVCKGIPIVGLDRTKYNQLRIRAIRGTGPLGPWSNYVNIEPA